MNKIFISTTIAAVIFVFSGNNSAEDKSVPQPLVIQPTPIIAPIPRPTRSIEVCPRNQPFAKQTEQEIIDGPIPLHCLQPNCGLGVYRKKENDTVERCSYCEAPKPEQG